MRKILTLPRWTEFGHRLQSTRRRVSALIETLPATADFTASRNALTWLDRRLGYSASYADGVLRQQHPRETTDVLTARAALRGEADDTLSVVHGSSSSGPVLSREKWTEIGAEVKAINSDIVALTREIQQAAGASRFDIAAFVACEKALGKARRRLSAALSRQYPDWESARVFHGPVERVRLPHPPRSAAS